MGTHHRNMCHHFSKVAPSYRRIRTTDPQPIRFISKKLKDLRTIKAADIGCGDGRYDLLLFEHLNNLHLTCIDINEHMLEQASRYLKSHGITNFKTIKAHAEVIPLEDNSMDCILTFNAVHHFDFVNFIKKSQKVIKENGIIFVYTRLRSQNAMNIWGQYFPLFFEKEFRLYELNDIEQWIQSVESLSLETAKSFKYKRNETMGQLVEKVKAKHYSTFALYQDDELDDALKIFQESIRGQFQDTDRIEWFDENILLVLRAG
ncbi:MAG: class I SAM-dependent methyltransferase [Desulfobacteraceae bacterium]|nr:MAG: class I SAM-dependent methyltransferase [Desulfobacteraceae bacterium]